jgi:hypothetical protein
MGGKSVLDSDPDSISSVDLESRFWIRIQEGKKTPKNRKKSCFEVLDVLF